MTKFRAATLSKSYRTPIEPDAPPGSGTIVTFLRVSCEATELERMDLMPDASQKLRTVWTRLAILGYEAYRAGVGGDEVVGLGTF